MPETINTDPSMPPRATVVCARCGGAFEPGLERCPTCGAPQTRPGATSGKGLGPGAVLLSLLWLVVPLVWVWPAVFRRLGLGPVSDWLEAGGHRMVVLVPFWLLSMAGFALIGSRSRTAMRQAWQAFATSSGGEVVTRPMRLEAGAWKGGVEVRTRARGWLLVLESTRDRSNVYTRLSCALSPRRDFHFALMPQSRVMKALSSPRVGGFLLALGEKTAVRGPDDQARHRALEEVGFMVGPAVELGEPEFDGAFLIKSDDADGARALLGSQRGTLLALRRPGSWWQLTLIASVTTGTGQLEYRENGVVSDAARLAAVRQAMIPMLEALAASGIIAAESPASNA